MATLRDPLFAPNTVSLDEMQQLQDADKGSLRRGWEAGRIGAERNALAIDEFAAQAAGDSARANTLRAQNDALAQAQARVAPEVQRVEDINWDPGRALNWAGGVIGQGVSSMVEPVAATTALGAVGRVAGVLPGAAGKVGAAIGTVGGPLAAYALNQRQLAGEFANTAMQDKELMARTTPQERYNMANMYGGVAGLADTALTGIIGHQLTGGALRAGMKATGAGMGPAAKTALGMAGEGFTEYAQGKGSQYAQGLLNPNRDTSGDASDNLNNALGGVIGGSPLIAAGAYADAGFRRVGQAAGTVGTKTGDLVDLAKAKYDGSALQGGVDKAMAAGKQKAGDMVDLLDHVRGDDGKISLAKMADLAESARDGANELVQRYKVSAEERDLLNLTPPPEVLADPTKNNAWFADASEKRTQLVADRLSDMAETDPKAAEILDRLASTEDYVQQQAIADEGAQHVLETNEIEQLATRGQRAAAAFGELASKGATALGKGAVVAGKAAMGFGKAVFDGAAAEARKKNAQGAPDTSYDAWKKRRDEMRGGALPIEDQVERHQVGNRALDREAIKNDPATAAAKLRSRRRAELFGEILEAEARSARAVFATRADPAVEDAFGLITRHAGYELADIAESWGMKGPKQQGGFGLAAGTRQTPVLTMALDRIANSLRVALRDRAAPALDQLQAQSDAGAAPLFDYVRERITSTGTPAGRKAMEAVRTNVANELMMLVPDERRTEIMRGEAEASKNEGGKAKRGQLTRAWLLESVEALANGHESPKFREAFDEAFGKAVVDEMIGRLNTAGVAAPKLMKGTVDDGGVQGEAGVNDDGEYEAEQATDFDKRQAEKTVAKGSGPKVYGFANQGIQSLRGSTDRRDPFAPIAKMTAKQKAEFEETNERRMAEGLEPLAGAPVKRPGLFKLDDQLSDDTEAELVPDGKGGLRRPTKLEHKLAQMAKATQQYKDDEDSGHRVDKQSALDVMKDLGFQPAKILSIYRDYMLQDAGNKNLPAGERVAARTAAGVANRAVLDTMDQKDGKSAGLRLNAGERKKIMQAAEAYFKERYVAVAEKLSDAVPNRMELTELLNMGRAGAKIVSLAGQDETTEFTTLDEANLITFQSDLLKNKDRGLHIKADTLVNWVRTQRKRTEETGDEDGQSSKDVNQAYLDDLMEGIAAVVDSGMVDEKMPTRINAKGEYESFAKGIPRSLRLVTKHYWQLEQERDERSDKRIGEELVDPQGSRYQNAVRRDQNRNEEYFVVDDLEGLEPEPTYSTTREAKHPSVGTAGRGRTTTYAERPTYTGGEEMTPTQLAGERKLAADQLAEERKIRAERSEAAGAAAGETPAKRDARRARLAESERDRERERLRRPLGAVRAVGTADAKTSGDNATPLDFYPKQKRGAVPDEFADQQFRSKSGPSVYDPLPTEHMMSAPGKAKDRAGPIIQALRGEIGTQEEGLNMIVSRIKAAETASTKNGAAGGLQYLYPAAAALQPGLVDAIGTFKGSVPEMDSHLKMLRGQIFRILRDGVPKADWNTGKVSIEPVSMRHQLAIAKLLMGKHADKVTAQTVKDVIARRAAETESGLDYFAVGEAPELKDITKKPLTPLTRQDGKSEGVRKKGDDPAFPGDLARTPNKVINEDGSSRTVSQEFVDRQTAKSKMRSASATDTIGALVEQAKAKKPNAIAEAVARKNAASEVAATQAPKSQSKPSGVDLGAKGLYAAKDQAKSDQATKFIGRGSPASSTAKYAAAWGDRANTGSYTASDRVFVSAEGNRSGRIAPDFRELKKATSAGATIITDSKANRERAYNVGEREVAEFLQAQGYSEVAPGVWSPGVIAASRLGIIADKAGAKTDPDVAKAANELITLASGAWEQGTGKKEFLASEAARRALAVLAARKLVGAPRAQEAIDAVMAIVDQIYGVVQDRVLLNKVRARLVETMMSKRPVMLADILADYATSRLPAGVKAIARAVQKVAGDTAVRAESRKAVGGEGVYNATTDSIMVALAAHNPLHTVLHEGVHAATISAVVKDAELHKALYSLMAHAVAHDPALQQAYGFTNTLEFLAEGLSNSGLQRRLYKVPANKTVEKYLGATVANAWDAFVSLVRKALNLPAEHQSALTQLLDLSGRAMKAVGQSPDRLTSADEHASAAERTLVPQKMVERLIKQLADLPGLSKETRESISDQFSPDDSPHFDALVLTALIKELTSKPVPDGSITPDALQHIGDKLASALEHMAFPNKIGAADWSDTGARKLNAQSASVAGVIGTSREIMRTLGFKSAPEQFSDVAAKLLSDPTQNPDKFIAQSAEGLSHLLMEGKSGEQIREMLGKGPWFPVRAKITARFVQEGMKRGDALVASYREITRMALAAELVARSEAEKSFVGRVKQMAKDFMSRFKEMTDSAEFADLVRNNLNDLIAKAKGPIDLKANYKKVSFQEAVDGDPQAARVLAHMSKNPNIAITGSIVLANNGTIYRDAANMLHDLDFIVQGTKEAAEAHLRAAFPDAVQIYDFATSRVKVDTFLVPPAGAKIANIVREYGEKGKVLSFEVVRNGEVIGRTWNDKYGEHKSGDAGTFVDLFTGSPQLPVASIPFTTGGEKHSIRAVAPGGIFAEKLSMGRSKDLNDYLWFEPVNGRKLSAMSTKIHNDLQRGGFAATHDSPIRHEGKFNWRKHAGKGEGNAAFGAGTYLSTADGVHRSYKEQFTAEIAQGLPKPTWLGHFVIDPNGTDPGMVQVEGIIREIENTPGISQEIADAIWEMFDACIPVVESVVGGRTRLEYADPSLMKPFPKGIVDEIGKLHKGAARWMGEFNTTLAARRTPKNPGGKSPTYEVSVNIKPEQLLNWDKPLSEQSELVKSALGGMKEAKSLVVRDITSGAVVEERQKTGADIYRALAKRLGSQAAVSDYLQSLGILGHKYAASGGKNDTHPNYVIYDDSKITTNYVHFNRQGGNSRVASQAEMDEAKAYVRKVLGPQIKVEFKDITGYSGEWLDAQQAIEISTTAAAGVLSTAYHEALHGFFSKFVKNDPRALDVLKSLAENEKILARVAALLADHPAAIDQLKSGEERLAYIYQFWAAGKLDLPIGKPRTLLQKVRKFFRRVLGLVKDSERAVALFEAFHGGQLAEPSAAGKVIANILDEGTGVLKARRKLDGLTQWLAAKTMPAETILTTSESKAAQALAKEFFTNPGDEDAGGEAEGYLNARRRVAARYNNTFAQAVNGLTDRDMTEVAKYLQGEAELADIPYAPHREAVAKIRGLLQRFYKYMSDERGLELGHAGEKYYPRVWNTALLHEKKDDFLKMLTTHYDAVLEQGVQGSKGKLSKEQVADRIWRALIDREGVNDKLDAQRQDGVLAPFFASKENRTLAWLQGEHAEPFLEKNLVATLSRYFHQGVRAAEYTERFGADGEILEAKLREIMGELQDLSHAKLKRKEFKDDDARAKWVSRQYRDVAEAVGAMEGTLGKDISSGWRKANSWMTVYQNVRLLPLSLFASFVDPLGMVARGATMREAYEAFLRGMKEVVTNWGDLFREEPKERQADKWEKLAEHVGAVDAALFAHHVSDEYSSVYMERGAKKINDTMFKLNGMEAWNRGMRVAGVKSAVAFIERHAAGADKVHSERWLKELGLDPKNIPLDADGHLITDKSVLMQQKGMGKSQAEREIDAVHYAINRWVEGAILTPNAAQRPAWGSDPHYSMFFHLKQFSYSFHQTILKRAVKEMNHGNLAPMGAFVWYIPTMIAADITKGLIQGGGELPAYMKGYDLGDHVMRAVQRSGVLGAAQLGVDAQGDMFSLAGPGVEQAIDAMREPIGQTMLKAAPAHGLYAEAFR